MADLPHKDRTDEAALKRYMTRCGGFITVSEGEYRLVEWIDTAAKAHLETYAKDQLSLTLNDVQHGIIALRCLEYIRTHSPSALEDYQDNTTDQTQEEPNQEYSPAAIEDESNYGDEEKTRDYLHVIDGEEEQGQVQEALASNESVAAQTKIDSLDEWGITEQPFSPTITYPEEYWLEHAKLAPVDIVEEFDLGDSFWAEESSSRAAWWETYADANSYKGLRDLTSLHIAVLTGFSALVDHLLANGFKHQIHSIDSWGYRPFHWACDSGDIYIVRQLLKAGADLDVATNDEKLTALWLASSGGHEECVRYLLDEGAQINVENETYGTALYASVEQGWMPIVKLLLDRQANVNLVGGLHRRALNAAAYYGHKDIVEELLEKGADVDPQEEYRYGSALGAAARKGHKATACLLLEKGWNASRQGGTYGSILVIAATYGHAEVMQALLEKDHDVPSREQALEMASKNGRTDAVKKLLEHSPFLRHQRAFLCAASFGQDDIVRLLKERGVDQQTLNKALYDASDHEHESTVKLLLEFGADPNAEGDE